MTWCMSSSYLYTSELEKAATLLVETCISAVLRTATYAREVSRRYGSYTYRDWVDERDRVTAYCVPKYLKKGTVEVY